MYVSGNLTLEPTYTNELTIAVKHVLVLTHLPSSLSVLSYFRVWVYDVNFVLKRTNQKF